MIYKGILVLRDIVIFVFDAEIGVDEVDARYVLLDFFDVYRVDRASGGEGALFDGVSSVVRDFGILGLVWQLKVLVCLL